MGNKDLNFQEDLNNALDCLLKGGLILYPTDTIWGIGCDARNSNAVKRIYELKKRDDSKSMLVLTDSADSLKNLVEDVPPIAMTLIEFSENPLTIIYERAKNVADELLASDGSLGIRVTSESFTRELCKRLGGSLVSTSANVSGEKSPASFQEISEEIKQGVDYIVKYRQNDNAQQKPSSIIKIGKEGVFKILR